MCVQCKVCCIKSPPPLITKVAVTGKADHLTLQAIREFQKRFMEHPDGRVDPSGRTLLHLNDGFASQYAGCSANKKRTIDGDMILAQKWLDTALVRLAFPNDVSVQTKVKNIFSI